MKCSKCSESAEYTFLKKFKGTFINTKSKKKFVCSSCQSTKNVGEKK